MEFVGTDGTKFSLVGLLLGFYKGKCHKFLDSCLEMLKSPHSIEKDGILKFIVASGYVELGLDRKASKFYQVFIDRSFFGENFVFELKLNGSKCFQRLGDISTAIKLLNQYIKEGTWILKVEVPEYKEHERERLLQYDELTENDIMEEVAYLSSFVENPVKRNIKKCEDLIEELKKKLPLVFRKKPRKRFCDVCVKVY